jgi:uncharacterized protein (TIGR03435 family)
MRIPILVSILGAAAAAPFMLAQKAAPVPPDLAFEVASLKSSAPGGRGGGIRPAPGGERYVATNAPVRLMIAVAYGVKADQIAGGPDWVANEGFDMDGRAGRPANIDELHVMLQNLLTERFKLQFHRETRELPIYALTVDKTGPKLKEHPFANAGEPWVETTLQQAVQMKLNARSVTMNYFAFRLSQLLDRTVVDYTGLKGDFDFELNYTRDLPPGIPEGATINGQTIDTSGPPIFAAMPKQLGLRLEPRKGPVSVFVIDSVERPSGN